MKKEFVYFDYQSSTPIDKRVLDRMLPYFTEEYANPHSSDHYMGWMANKSIEGARQSVSKIINAEKDEVLFTSGATEANNLALKGLVSYLKSHDKNKIIVSSLEHKSVLKTVEHLAKNGIEVCRLQPDKNGFVSEGALKEKICNRTGLVSIMMVNNEVGSVQKIKTFAKIAHENGAFFHTDAAQAPIFMKIDVRELGVDLLSLSGHKIYGPKGIGVLFINNAIKEYIEPLIDGGGQEFGLRSGTLPTALCVGFASALENIEKERSRNIETLQERAQSFLKEIKGIYPRVRLNGAKDNRHPGNLNLCFQGYNAKHILQSLQPKLAASAGSACNSGIEDPSHVLLEMGLNREDAEASIRFSFGIDQTDDDIKRGTELLKGFFQSSVCAA